LPSSQAPPPGGTAIDPTSVRPDLDDAVVERIERAALRHRLRELREEGLTMLLDIGGADYLERVPRFDVVYHLLALPQAESGVEQIGTPRRVRLLVGVPGDDATVPSVTDLWVNADWAEREIFDLYGITFEGHPDLRRVQMPYDWEGHPLRKDYPLRGPARERAPRPSFPSKSNVPAGTPPSSRVSEALQRQIARARGEEKAE
jgi:NADH-quinone oxidoreductase subunit C